MLRPRSLSKAVLALAALAVACGAAKPKVAPEPTLLEFCYAFEMPMPEFCSDPQPMPWPKGEPIRVYIDPRHPHPDIVKATAIMWNRWLGADVLVPADGEDDADILVTVAPEGAFGNAVGMMQHVLENGKPLVLITLYGDAEHSIEVIAHELGHALGLEHDPELKESLMYPSVKFIRPRVTDADIKALRKHLGVKLKR